MELTDLLPRGAKLCLVTDAAPRGRKPIKPRWFDTPEKLVRKLPQLVAAEESVWIAHAGFTAVDGAVARTRAHVSIHKSFVCDIDLKKEEGDSAYDTVAEAVTAIAGLIERGTMLTPSAVVVSGHGLHLWWGLTAEISTTQWLPLAQQLRRLMPTVDPLLCSDMTRVADPNGLLRPWPSINWKHADEPRGVKQILSGDLYELAEFESWVAQAPAATSTIGAAVQAPRGRAVDIIGLRHRNLLASGPAARTRVPMKNVEACGVIDYWQTTAKKHGTEPQWYLLAQLSAYLDEGLEAFDALSKGGRSYNRESVESYYARFDATALGPTTCAKLREALDLDSSCAQCAGCPLLGKANASPVNLPVKLAAHTIVAHPKAITDAGAIADVTAQLQVMPKYLDAGNRFYYVAKHNALMLANRGDEGELDPQVVANGLLWYNGYFHDAENKRFYVGYFKDNDVYREVVTPAVTVADTPSAVKVLSAHGLQVRNPNYARQCIGYLFESANTTRIETARKMGYEASRGFILGSLIVRHNGSVEPVRPIENLATYTKSIQFSGTLDGSKRLLAIYEQHAVPAARLALLAPFITVINALAPKVLPTIHLHGPTGTGKTAVLAAMHSVYGSSTPDTLSGSQGDTMFSIGQIMSTYDSLPVPFDESTQSPSARKNLTFVLAGGRGKNASNNTMNGLREQSTWTTCAVSTGNQALAPLGTGTEGALMEGATEMRVLDLPIPRGTLEPGPDRAAVAGEAIDLYTENNGVMMVHFLQHLLPRKAEIVAKLTAARKALIRSERTELRFFNNLAACHSVAVDLLQQLGYIQDTAVWGKQTAAVIWERINSVAVRPVAAKLSDVMALFISDSLGQSVSFEPGRVVPPRDEHKPVIMRFEYFADERRQRITVQKRALSVFLDRHGIASDSLAELLTMAPAGVRYAPVLAPNGGFDHLVDMAHSEQGQRRASAVATSQPVQCLMFDRFDVELEQAVGGNVVSLAARQQQA